MIEKNRQSKLEWI